MELQLTVHTFFLPEELQIFFQHSKYSKPIFVFSSLVFATPLCCALFPQKRYVFLLGYFFFNVTLPDACKILQRDTNKLSLLSRAYSLNSHITNVIKMRIFIKVIVTLLISNTQLNWANSFTNCQQLQRCSEVGIQSKRGLGEQFNRSISSWKLPWLQRTALDYMCLFAI